MSAFRYEPGEQPRMYRPWVHLAFRLLILLFLVVVTPLVVASCGGGGGGSGTAVVRPAKLPDLPLQFAATASNAPILYVGSSLHVGADVAPPASRLTPSAVHGDVRVSHGHVKDGIGADELVAYLSADAQISEYQSYIGVERFGVIPPTVRVAAGTNQRLLDETVRAVQLINAALPQSWQLRFSAVPGPVGIDRGESGEILVEFTPREDWPLGTESDEMVGIARHWVQPPGEVIDAHIWVDNTRIDGEYRLGIIVHEIIHALGRNHPDPHRFPNSIMTSPPGEGLEIVPNHVLHPLDREALLAVYGRLQPRAAPESLATDLGPWADTSIHVRGGIATGNSSTTFGVALRNGLGQPWVTGPAPYTDLADNPELTGTASWSGQLLGLTPSAEAVAGDADLSVRLTTLEGDLDFTNLESWAAGRAPGAIGTGTTWSDGDLGYDIGIRGNTFVRTGGDSGNVTGAFFGPRHEGMGGVVHRTDLSAAFGGTR